MLGLDFVLCGWVVDSVMEIDPGLFQLTMSWFIGDNSQCLREMQMIQSDQG